MSTRSAPQSVVLVVLPRGVVLLALLLGNVPPGALHVKAHTGKLSLVR